MKKLGFGILLVSVLTLNIGFTADVTYIKQQDGSVIEQKVLTVEDHSVKIAAIKLEIQNEQTNVDHHDRLAQEGRDHILKLQENLVALEAAK